MMDELVKEIRTILCSEYERASARHGRVNNSDHESFAIILEEIQEASDEVRFCASAADRLWELIKKDSHDEEKLKSLNLVKEYAIRAASEFVQVAATALKAEITINERSD